MCRSRRGLMIVAHASWREFAAPFVSSRPGRRFVEEKPAAFDQDTSSLLDLVRRDFLPVAGYGIDRGVRGSFVRPMFRRYRLHSAKARANPPLHRGVAEGCR